MMARDKKRDISYFKKFVQNTEQLITEDIEYLASGKIKKDRIPWVEYNIFTSSLEVLIAKYSMGVNCDELTCDANNVISLMEKYYNPLITKVNSGSEHKDVFLDQYRVESYGKMLQVLSLAYLLNVSDADFQILVGIIDRDNISDNLYEFIIEARLSRCTQKREEEYDKDKSVVLKVYKRLREATKEDDKEKASQLVKGYIEKDFYHKHCGFYQSHKSKFDIYFGYWSFEAAAVVRIRGLDDSSFRDHPYYPSDLV